MSNKILRQYDIVIGADTRKLMSELNKTEKELKNKLKDFDISAGVKEEIKTVLEEIKAIKAELKTSTGDLKAEFSKVSESIKTGEIKKNFEELSTSINGSVKEISDSVTALNTTLSTLNERDFSKVGSAISDGLKDATDNIKNMLSTVKEYQGFIKDIKDGKIVIAPEIKTGVVDPDADKKALKIIQDYTADRAQKISKILSGATKIEKDKMATTLQELLAYTDAAIKAYDSMSEAGKKAMASNNKVNSFNETVARAQLRQLESLFKGVLTKGTEAQKEVSDVATTITDMLKEALDDVVKTKDTKKLNETIKKVEELVLGFEKLSNNSTINLKFESEIDPNTTAETIVSKIKGSIDNLLSQEKNKIKVPITIDKKDFEKQLTDAIKEENNVLKTSDTIPKVEVGLKFADIDDADIEKVSNNLNGKIKLDLNANGTQTTVEGANISIDTTNLAKEKTLASIKDLLTNWLSGKLQVGSAKNVSMANDPLRDARNLIRGKYLHLDITKEAEIAAETRKEYYKLFKLNTDAKRMLESLDRYRKNISNGKEGYTAEGYKKKLQESDIYNKTVKINGKEYSIYSSMTKPVLIEEWRKSLDESLNAESTFIKDTIARVKNQAKSKKELLAGLGVEVKNNGDIIADNRTALGKNSIFQAALSELKQETNALQEEAMKAGLQEQYEVLQLLTKKRDVMQQIVKLSEEDPESDELYILEDQLKTLTLVVDKQDEYNAKIKKLDEYEKKRQSGVGLSNKESLHVVQLQKEIDELFRETVTDVIQYSKDNLDLIDTEVAAQQAVVKKQTDSFYKKVRSLHARIVENYGKTTTDSWVDKNGEVHTKKVRLTIENENDYADQRKHLKEMTDELNVYNKSITNAKGQKNFDALTDYEKSRYNFLQRQIQDLKDSLSLYVLLHEGIDACTGAQKKFTDTVGHTVENAKTLKDVVGALEENATVRDASGKVKTQTNKYSSASDKMLQEAYDKLDKMGNGNFEKRFIENVNSSLKRSYNTSKDYYEDLEEQKENRKKEFDAKYNAAKTKNEKKKLEEERIKLKEDLNKIDEKLSSARGEIDFSLKAMLSMKKYVDGVENKVINFINENVDIGKLSRSQLKTIMQKATNIVLSRAKIEYFNSLANQAKDKSSKNAALAEAEKFTKEFEGYDIVEKGRKKHVTGVREDFISYAKRTGSAIENKDLNDELNHIFEVRLNNAKKEVDDLNKRIDDLSKKSGNEERIAKLEDAKAQAQATVDAIEQIHSDKKKENEIFSTLVSKNNAVYEPRIKSINEELSKLKDQEGTEDKIKELQKEGNNLKAKQIKENSKILSQLKEALEIYAKIEFQKQEIDHQDAVLQVKNRQAPTEKIEKATRNIKTLEQQLSSVLTFEEPDAYVSKALELINTELTKIRNLNSIMSSKTDPNVAFKDMMPGKGGNVIDVNMRENAALDIYDSLERINDFIKEIKDYGGVGYIPVGVENALLDIYNATSKYLHANENKKKNNFVNNEYSREIFDKLGIINGKLFDKKKDAPNAGTIADFLIQKGIVGIDRDDLVKMIRESTRQRVANEVINITIENVKDLRSSRLSNNQMIEEEKRRISEEQERRRANKSKSAPKKSTDVAMADKRDSDIKVNETRSIEEINAAIDDEKKTQNEIRSSINNINDQIDDALKAERNTVRNLADENFNFYNSLREIYTDYYGDLDESITLLSKVAEGNAQLLPSLLEKAERDLAPAQETLEKEKDAAKGNKKGKGRKNKISRTRKVGRNVKGAQVNVDVIEERIKYYKETLQESSDAADKEFAKLALFETYLNNIGQNNMTDKDTAKNAHETFIKFRELEDQIKAINKDEKQFYDEQIKTIKNDIATNESIVKEYEKIRDLKLKGEKLDTSESSKENASTISLYKALNDKTAEDIDKMIAMKQKEIVDSQAKLFENTYVYNNMENTRQGRIDVIEKRQQELFDEIGFDNERNKDLYLENLAEITRKMTDALVKKRDEYMASLDSYGKDYDGTKKLKDEILALFDSYEIVAFDYLSAGGDKKNLSSIFYIEDVVNKVLKTQNEEIIGLSSRLVELEKDLHQSEDRQNALEESRRSLKVNGEPETKEQKAALNEEQEQENNLLREKNNLLDEQIKKEYELANTAKNKRKGEDKQSDVIVYSNKNRIDAGMTDEQKMQSFIIDRVAQRIVKTNATIQTLSELKDNVDEESAANINESIQEEVNTLDELKKIYLNESKKATALGLKISEETGRAYIDVNKKSVKLFEEKLGDVFDFKPQQESKYQKKREDVETSVKLSEDFKKAILGIEVKGIDDKEKAAFDAKEQYFTAGMTEEEIALREELYKANTDLKKMYRDRQNKVREVTNEEIEAQKKVIESIKERVSQSERLELDGGFYKYARLKEEFRPKTDETKSKYVPNYSNTAPATEGTLSQIRDILLKKFGDGSDGDNKQPYVRVKSLSKADKDEYFKLAEKLKVEVKEGKNGAKYIADNELKKKVDAEWLKLHPPKPKNNGGGNNSGNNGGDGSSGGATNVDVSKAKPSKEVKNLNLFQEILRANPNFLSDKGNFLSRFSSVVFGEMELKESGSTNSSAEEVSRYLRDYIAFVLSKDHKEWIGENGALKTDKDTKAQIAEAINNLKPGFLDLEQSRLDAIKQLISNPKGSEKESTAKESKEKPASGTTQGTTATTTTTTTQTTTTTTAAGSTSTSATTSTKAPKKVSIDKKYIPSDEEYFRQIIDKHKDTYVSKNGNLYTRFLPYILGEMELTKPGSTGKPEEAMGYVRDFIMYEVAKESKEWLNENGTVKTDKDTQAKIFDKIKGLNAGFLGLDEENLNAIKRAIEEIGFAEEHIYKAKEEKGTLNNDLFKQLLETHPEYKKKSGALNELFRSYLYGEMELKNPGSSGQSEFNARRSIYDYISYLVAKENTEFLTKSGTANKQYATKDAILEKVRELKSGAFGLSDDQLRMIKEIFEETKKYSDERRARIAQEKAEQEQQTAQQPSVVAQSPTTTTTTTIAQPQPSEQVPTEVTAPTVESAIQSSTAAIESATTAVQTVTVTRDERFRDHRMPVPNIDGIWEAYTSGENIYNISNRFKNGNSNLIGTDIIKIFNAFDTLYSYYTSLKDMRAKAKSDPINGYKLTNLLYTEEELNEILGNINKDLQVKFEHFVSAMVGYRSEDDVRKESIRALLNEMNDYPVNKRSYSAGKIDGNIGSYSMSRYALPPKEAIEEWLSSNNGIPDNYFGESLQSSTSKQRYDQSNFKKILDELFDLYEKTYIKTNVSDNMREITLGLIEHVSAINPLADPSVISEIINAIDHSKSSNETRNIIDKIKDTITGIITTTYEEIPTQQTQQIAQSSTQTNTALSDQDKANEEVAESAEKASAALEELKAKLSSLVAKYGANENTRYPFILEDGKFTESEVRSDLNTFKSLQDDYNRLSGEYYTLPMNTVMHSLDWALTDLKDETVFKSERSATNNYTATASDISNAIKELEKETGKTLAEVINQWKTLDANIKDTAKTILSGVDLINDNGEFNFTVAGTGKNTTGSRSIAILTDDFAILQKGITATDEELKSFIDIINNLRESGVNVAAVFENFRSSIEGSGITSIGYQIQERIHGNVLGTPVRGGKETDDTVKRRILELNQILESSDEEILKLISDYATLSKTVQTDPNNPSNFIHSNNGGYYAIDLGNPNKTTGTSSNETIIHELTASAINAAGLGKAININSDVRTLAANVAKKIAQVAINAGMVSVDEAFNSISNFQGNIHELVGLASAVDNEFAILDKHGKDTVKKYYEGALAETPEEKAAFEEIAKVPVDTIKKYLKISSPSLVMEKLGYWTGEGYKKGFIDDLDKLRDDIKEKFANGVVTEKDIKELFNIDAWKDDKALNLTDPNRSKYFRAFDKIGIQSILGGNENNEVVESSTSNIPATLKEVFFTKKGESKSEASIRSFVKNHTNIVIDALNEYAREIAGKSNNIPTLSQVIDKIFDTDKVGAVKVKSALNDAVSNDFNSIEKLMDKYSQARVKIANGTAKDKDLMDIENFVNARKDFVEKYDNTDLSKLDAFDKDRFDSIKNYLDAEEQYVNDYNNSLIVRNRLELEALKTIKSESGVFESLLSDVEQKLIEQENIFNGKDSDTKLTSADSLKAIRSMLYSLSSIQDVPDALLNVGGLSLPDNAGKIAEMLRGMEGIRDTSVQIRNNGTSIVGILDRANNQTETLEYVWNELLGVYVKTSKVLTSQSFIFDQLRDTQSVKSFIKTNLVDIIEAVQGYATDTESLTGKSIGFNDALDKLFGRKAGRISSAISEYINNEFDAAEKDLDKRSTLLSKRASGMGTVADSNEIERIERRLDAFSNRYSNIDVAGLGVVDEQRAKNILDFRNVENKYAEDTQRTLIASTRQELDRLKAVENVGNAYKNVLNELDNELKVQEAILNGEDKNATLPSLDVLNSINQKMKSISSIDTGLITDKNTQQSVVESLELMDGIRKDSIAILNNGKSITATVDEANGHVRKYEYQWSDILGVYLKIEKSLTRQSDIVDDINKSKKSSIKSIVGNNLDDVITYVKDYANNNAITFDEAFAKLFGNKSSNVRTAITDIVTAELNNADKMIKRRDTLVRKNANGKAKIEDIEEINRLNLDISSIFNKYNGSDLSRFGFVDATRLSTIESSQKKYDNIENNKIVDNTKMQSLHKWIYNEIGSYQNEVFNDIFNRAKRTFDYLEQGFNAGKLVDPEELKIVEKIINRLGELDEKDTTLFLPDTELTPYDAEKVFDLLNTIPGVRKETVKVLKDGEKITATIDLANGATKKLEYSWDSLLGVFVKSEKSLEQQMDIIDRINKNPNNKNLVRNNLGELVEAFSDNSNNGSLSFTQISDMLFGKNSSNARSTIVSAINDELVGARKKTEKINRIKIKAANGTATDDELNSIKELERELDIVIKKYTDLDLSVFGEEFNNGVNGYIKGLKSFNNITDTEDFKRSLLGSTEVIFNEILGDLDSQSNIFKDLFNKIGTKFQEQMTKFNNGGVVNGEQLKNLRLQLLQLNSLRGDSFNIMPDNIQRQDAGKIADMLKNMDGIRKSSIAILNDGKSIVGTIERANAQTETLEYKWNDLLGVYVKSSRVLTTQLGLFDRIGEQLSKTWSYFKSYIGGYLTAQRVISELRQGIQYVKELDKALTEMKKVSDESTSSLKDFQKASFDTANEIGSTAIQIQNSAADFMRLGYSLGDAATLAKDASVYANVGDMEIKEATEHMISSIQAWQSEFSSATEASTAIIDKYNEIGNNYAITSADIGSAMERSAAALKAAGNTLDESIGLITAGNLIQQDADTTANALKVMSLRIRGSKADLEDMGEETDGLASSTSKLRNELKALTGVDIMIDDKTYKSTAQIIKEIGANWSKLDDVSQSAALEKLAGKTRASTVAGLIENYKTIEEVANDAADAQGSAMKENEKYVDSIEGRIAQLNNEVQRFWKNVVDSDALKVIISSLTQIFSLLSKIEDLGMLSTSAGIWGLKSGLQNRGMLLDKGLFSLTRDSETGVLHSNLLSTISNSLAEKRSTNERRNIYKSDLKFVEEFQNRITELMKTPGDFNGMFNQAYSETIAEASEVTQKLVKDNKDSCLNIKEIFETSFGDVTNSVNKGSAAIQASTKILNGFKTVASTALSTLSGFLIGFVVEKAVTWIYNLVHAFDRVKEAASEASESIKSTIKDLASYSVKIEDLYSTINSEEASDLDKLAAREELLSLQDDMIEAYKDEAGSIDIIIRAINGETEALEELRRAKYDASKIDVNGGNGDRNTEKLKNVFWDQRFVLDLANEGIDLNKITKDELKEFEKAGAKFNLKIAATGEVEEVNLDNINWDEDKWNLQMAIEGDVDEIYESLVGIDDIIKHNTESFSSMNNVLDYHLKSYKDLNSEYSKTKDYLKESIYFEMILENKQASNAYLDVQDAYDNYKNAKLHGTKDDVDEAIDDYQKIIESIDSNTDIDERSKKYLKDLHPELNVEIKNRENDKWVKGYLKGVNKEIFGDKTAEQIVLMYESMTQEVRDKILSDESLKSLYEEYVKLISDGADQNAIDAIARQIQNRLDEQNITLSLDKFIEAFEFQDAMNVTGTLKERVSDLIGVLTNYGLATSKVEEKQRSLNKSMADGAKNAKDKLSSLYTYLEKARSGALTSGDYIDILSEYGEDGILKYADNIEDGLDYLIKNTLETTLDDIRDVSPELTNAFEDAFKNVKADTKVAQLNEDIDKLQEGLKTLSSAFDEYNENGFITLDTLQALTAENGEYLSMLTIEDGQLKINEEAYKSQVAAKLNDLKTTLSEAAANEINALAQAKANGETERGVVKLNALSIAYETATASAAAFAREQGVTDEEINKIIDKYDTIFNKAADGFNNNFKVFSGATTSSASDTADTLKEELDNYIAYQDALLDAGKISYDEYTKNVRSKLDGLYSSGKLTAKDYFDYVQKLLEKQLSIYDEVLSAVARRYDKEIEKIDDQIEAINEENDALNKQKDEYDKILSVVQEVYDKEIESLQNQQEAIQDKIDALQKANDEEDRALALANARYALEKAQQQRTRLVYNGAEGFVYQTDPEAIRNAKKELKDAELENTVAALEDEKEALDKTIETLEEYKEKWSDISEVYDKEVNRQLAIALWGENYEQMILQNREQDIQDFTNKYVDLQKKVDDNTSLIESFEEKKKYYEELKAQWQEITDIYKNSIEDQHAAMVLGADWENEILSGRTTALEKFKNEYIAIQEQIKQAAIDSANAQAAADKGGSGSSSGGGFDSGMTVSSDKKAYEVINSHGDNATGAYYNTKEEAEEARKAMATKDPRDLGSVREITGFSGFKILRQNANGTLQKFGNDKLFDTYEDAVKVLNDPGSEYNKKLNEGWKFVIKLQKFAKGGVINANGNNPLKDIASKVGEDTAVLARHGERILTPVQNQYWEKWTNAIPNLTKHLEKLKFNTPNLSSILNAVASKETTVKQEISISLPNVTNNSGAEYVINALKTLPLEAVQRVNRR